MLLCLGEPPVAFLGCCYSSFLIFILLFVLHLSMFFIFVVASSLTFPFRRHPSPFCGLSSRFLHHVLYFQLSPSQSDSRHFHFLTIPLSSCHKLRPWVGIFYPQVFFTLYMLLHQHFNLCLSRLPWEPAVLPWSMQGFLLNPGPSVCLIHSNEQTSHSERFSFKFCYILA